MAETTTITLDANTAGAQLAAAAEYIREHGLPPDAEGALFPPGAIEEERHDGMLVSSHEVRFSGGALVDRRYEAEQSFWRSLKIGRTGVVRLVFEVDGDGHAPQRFQGEIVGMTEFRKLKVSSLIFEHDDE